MSFFQQTKRNTDFPVQNNPSPFDYSVNKDRKKSYSYAPFNSTVKLNRTPVKQQKVGLALNTQEDKIFTIDDNNIQVIAQQRMQSMFKSRSQRIINKIQNVPGPGSYELRSTYKNVRVLNQSYNSHHISITQRLANAPSIPTDNLGYKCISDSKIQKVQQKKVMAPVPGTYNLRTDLIKDNGLSWTNHVTISRKQDDAPLPGPGSYNSNKSMDKTKAPSSCFNSTYDRFNPKKIKKSYVPGPGHYNTQGQLQLNHQYSQKHFNSKSLRFPIDKGSNIGPGSYISSNRSQKNLSKRTNENKNQRQTVQSNRKTIFSNQNNKMPGPGEYIAREGMTFQLQKALLRKHNLSQFPNSRRQVFQPKEVDDPGPGAYDPTLPKSNSKGNIGYHKIQVVNLKQNQQNIQSPSPMQYNFNNHTLAKKVEQQSKRLTLTQKKPFNVGSQRFDHYSANKNNPQQRNHTYDTENNQSVDGDHAENANFEGSKRVKKLIMTSVKVKVPFGTSTSKFDKMRQETEVGPGQYGSSNNWIKQSHNIKGKFVKKQK